MNPKIRECHLPVEGLEEEPSCGTCQHSIRWGKTKGEQEQQIRRCLQAAFRRMGYEFSQSNSLVSAWRYYAKTGAIGPPQIINRLTIISPHRCRKIIRASS